ARVATLDLAQGEADGVQRPFDRLIRGLARRNAVVPNGLIEVRLDPPQRIEGGKRILEDRLDLPTEPFAVGTTGNVADVAIFEQHMARRRLDETKHHAGE